MTISKRVWQLNSLSPIHAYSLILLDFYGGEFLKVWEKIIHNSQRYIVTGKIRDTLLSINLIFKTSVRIHLQYYSTREPLLF